MTKIEKHNSPIDNDITENVKSFDELIDSVTDLDPKLKHLWAQIYQNAIVDRRYARLAYEDLIQKVLAVPENHGLYGDKLAKYLEKMNKTTDQLLQLSKFISEHTTGDSVIDKDDLYSKFNK